LGRGGQKKYVKEFDGEASKGKIRLEKDLGVVVRMILK
jgi:hypothetical protein